MEARISLFGPIKVESAQLLVSSFPTKRSGYVLARLAVARDRRMRRSDLAEALWPGDHPDATLPRLRQELTRLRKTLGPLSSLVQSSPDWVQLAEPKVHIDLFDFESIAKDLDEKGSLDESTLIRGLELSRLDFLADCEDDWIQVERQRLWASRYKLFLTLIDTHLGAGNSTSAHDLATAAIDEFPYEEAAYLLASQALRALGHPADALAQSALFERRRAEYESQYSADLLPKILRVNIQPSVSSSLRPPVNTRQVFRSPEFDLRALVQICLSEPAESASRLPVGIEDQLLTYSRPDGSQCGLEWFVLGVCRRLAGDRTSAIAWFRKSLPALESDRNRAEALDCRRRLVETALELEDQELARIHASGLAEEAVALNRRDYLAGIYLSLGQINQQNKQLLDAELMYRRSLVLQRTFGLPAIQSDTYFFLGQTLLAHEQYYSAKEAFRSADMRYFQGGNEPLVAPALLGVALTAHFVRDCGMSVKLGSGAVAHINMAELLPVYRRFVDEATSILGVTENDLVEAKVRLTLAELLKLAQCSDERPIAEIVETLGRIA
jgi:DNA-binding SARP family transcriptional activator